jgi:hypothetical protein
MNTTTRLTATALALMLAAGGAAGTAAASHEAGVDAAPGVPGATATHPHTVHVGEDTAGEWSGFAVDYGGANASVRHVTRSDLGVVGVDAGGDDPAATVDVVADVRSVDAADGTLTVALAGEHSLAAGDEVVVVVGNVTNPDATGEYDVPVDLDPGSDAGETTATLSVHDPAAVSMRDQTTGGDAVAVESVTLPAGGYVVVRAADGSALGHSGHLAAGRHEGVTVPLADPLDGSARLVATVHVDDGDREYGSSDADRPYLTAAGDPVADAARVTLGTVEPTPVETTAVPTDAEIASVEATDATATEGAERTTADDTAPATAPGFGAASAVVALVAVALVAAGLVTLRRT